MRYEARLGVEIRIGTFVCAEEVPLGVGEGGVTGGVWASRESGLCGRRGGRRRGGGHSGSSGDESGDSEGEERYAASGWLEKGAEGRHWRSRRQFEKEMEGGGGDV